jgi:hypothetical protein
MSSPSVELYRNTTATAFLVADVLVFEDMATAAPTALDWAAYLRALRPHLSKIQRCLIMPSPGGLTARQREEAREQLGGRRTAVLTASIVNRGIITSLSWFKVPLCAFPLGAYGPALLWLERAPLLADVLSGLKHYSHSIPVAAACSA